MIPDNIKQTLVKIYGSITYEKPFPVEVRPEKLECNKYCETLRRIYAELQNNYAERQNYRGYQELASRNSLKCDAYVESANFVLEWDERQHFSRPREIALRLYPDDLKIGFDKNRWIALCSQKPAKDNNPPHRDEQRAWLDTLRDFLPELISDLKPTVRLYKKDPQWRNINPEDPDSVEYFRALLAQKR